MKCAGSMPSLDSRPMNVKFFWIRRSGDIAALYTSTCGFLPSQGSILCASAKKSFFRCRVSL
jgi:hypothetical protein